MTDTPKHTPGPWSVIDGYYPQFKEISGPSFKISAVMWAWDLNENDYQIRNADLQLIAAAPEMLEALKALRKACWGGCACTDPSEEENAAWDLAKASVDKAEGRQHE
jgi:hypothetical protein